MLDTTIPTRYSFAHGGKIVKEWTETDMLGIMQQLGVLTPPKIIDSVAGYLRRLYLKQTYRSSPP